jgi:hypothetical protein
MFSIHVHDSKLAFKSIKVKKTLGMSKKAYGSHNEPSKEPRFKKRGTMKGNEGDCIPLTPAPHSSPP